MKTITKHELKLKQLEDPVQCELSLAKMREDVKEFSKLLNELSNRTPDESVSA
jgi:hypothetical protein